MPARWTRRCGAAIALHLLAGAAPAFACACCSNTASRTVEVEKLSGPRMAEIERMNFAGTAKLATGEADAAIKGVEAPATDYRLAVSRGKDRMVFTLRDDKGRSGMLALAIPKSISIFEVDPRGGEPDSGLGPTLYKEWQLTGTATVEGVLRPLVEGGDQKVTLIVHGRGRGCTEASEFTDWTLMLHGPVGKLTLYGALTSAAR